MGAMQVDVVAREACITGDAAYSLKSWHQDTAQPLGFTVVQHDLESVKHRDAMEEARDMGFEDDLFAVSLLRACAQTRHRQAIAPGRTQFPGTKLRGEHVASGVYADDDAHPLRVFIRHAYESRDANDLSKASIAGRNGGYAETLFLSQGTPRFRTYGMVVLARGFSGLHVALPLKTRVATSRSRQGLI